jgi:hypothetical protein
MRSQLRSPATTQERENLYAHILTGTWQTPGDLQYFAHFNKVTAFLVCFFVVSRTSMVLHSFYGPLLRAPEYVLYVQSRLDLHWQRQQQYRALRRVHTTTRKRSRTQVCNQERKQNTTQRKSESNSQRSPTTSHKFDA